MAFALFTLDKMIEFLNSIILLKSQWDCDLVTHVCHWECDLRQNLNETLWCEKNLSGKIVLCTLLPSPSSLSGSWKVPPAGLQDLPQKKATIFTKLGGTILNQIPTINMAISVDNPCGIRAAVYPGYSVDIMEGESHLFKSKAMLHCNFGGKARVISRI